MSLKVGLAKYMAGDIPSAPGTRGPRSCCATGGSLMFGHSWRARGSWGLGLWSRRLGVISGLRRRLGLRGCEEKLWGRKGRGKDGVVDVIELD